MSTTVTYKGQTLTTVENQTKTLNTAGTWVEGDFTLTDVTQGGGGEWTTEGIADLTEPNGAIQLSDMTIGEYAFRGRTGVTSLAVTDCDVANYAFARCSGMTALTADGYCEMVGNNTFENCTGLTNVNLTAKGKFMGTNQYTGCTNMVTWKAPNHGLSSTGVEMNNVQMGNGMFRGCSNLTAVDYGHANAMFANTFNGCTALRTLVIRRSTVCQAQTWNANNFGGLFNNPTDSTIYVPQALISSYQTATNWSSAYSAGVTFAPIDGSEYEL